MHASSKFALKLDVADFFPSINRKRVLRYFEKLGYAPSVAFFLSKTVTLNDRLPQGAPTSPPLSNVLCGSLDARLWAFGKSMGLSYSRYADDLLLSGDRPLGTFHVDIVKRILFDEGFALNEKKTRWYGPGEVRRFVGLTVHIGKVKVARAFRRELSKQIHFIEKFGLEGHVEHFDVPDPFVAERLLGRLSYWQFIEPDNKIPQLLRERLVVAISRVT
jgi:RNA-directed DNA polymerase